MKVKNSVVGELLEQLLSHLVILGAVQAGLLESGETLLEHQLVVEVLFDRAMILSATRS